MAAHSECSHASRSGFSMEEPIHLVKRGGIGELGQTIGIEGLESDSSQHQGRKIGNIQMNPYGLRPYFEGRCRSLYGPQVPIFEFHHQRATVGRKEAIGKLKVQATRLVAKCMAPVVSTSAAATPYRGHGTSIRLLARC